MKFSDELLLAFVNGELAEAERAAVERAIRADPAIAARVAQHRARRSRVYGVVAGGRDGGGHANAAGHHGGAKVVQLDSIRAARLGPLATPPPAPQWTRRHVGALAAALLIGALAGAAGWHGLQGDTTLAALGSGGALVARGGLAEALSAQLASPGPSGRIRIGISFLSKDGRYCRSFVMDTTAGLACRDGSQWKMPVLVQGAAGAAWMDGTVLPTAVSAAIAARIDGTPLSSAAERTVQARGWR